MPRYPAGFDVLRRRLRSAVMGAARARVGRNGSSPGATLGAMGYRLPRSGLPRPAPVDLTTHGASRPPPRDGPARRHEKAVVSVCSVDHLHFARTMFESFRAHHPDFDAYLVLADSSGQDHAAELPGVTIVPAQDLEVPAFAYLALKYSAYELCCALKPYALAHVHARGHETLVYIDADICVYAPFTTFLSALATHRFVTTPHTRQPMPSPERFWERPSLGDLAYAGPLNAGLFGLRATPDALRFLASWQRMVTCPGACVGALGGQMEQNAFNWIACFADDVHVLRDPAYNVAYWNLHERSLRWKGLDDGQPAAVFTVDRSPLVAFHFSGFSPFEPLRISRHDHRYSMYLMPSLTRLFADYAERLFGNGAQHFSAIGYGFDAFPSGVAIDARMRLLFKEHELQLRADVDPWTAEGEAVYCEALLSPLAARSSLLPLLLQRIYEERPDLRLTWPDAPTSPGGLLDWLRHHGVREYAYERLYDCHRPALPALPASGTLARDLTAQPSLLAGLSRPLTADRKELLRRLAARNLGELHRRVREYEAETYFVSPLHYIWQAYAARTDLARAFPDALYSDAGRFAGWLRTSGGSEIHISEHCVQRFLRCASGQSLARLFSYVNRNWDLMERWPLAFVGEGRTELATTLLGLSAFGLEYELDDVVTYLWTMEQTPWAGLPLALEQLVNVRRRPSSLLSEGQDALLGGLLGRDPRWAQALEAYRERFAEGRHAETEAFVRSFEQRTERPIDVTTVLTGVATRSRPGNGHAHQPEDPRTAVNVFGFFQSPIGLGTHSRGLSSALQTAGFRVQENVLGNVAMADSLSPDDFVRTFDHRCGVNVFVSFPHQHEAMLNARPEWMVRQRQNVACLAWEQREGNELWADIYREYDQVWAISTFAARGLEQCLKRKVRPVPCVLDTARLPPASAKRAAGLPDDQFTFLTVFDANSSVERKNPEAVLRAFELVLGGRRDVLLVIRVSNWWRLEHRERLRALLDAAARLGPRVRLVTEPLSHDGVLRLLSAADCYVSLHRSEGFGYTCAEAMAYERPVIATRYSGNLDFMTDANSYLVDAPETEVAVADGPFHRGSVWAEPRIEQAAALMRHVLDCSHEARARGIQAGRDVRRLLSPEAVGLLMRSHLSGAAETGTPAEDPPARPPLPGRALRGDTVAEQMASFRVAPRARA